MALESEILESASMASETKVAVLKSEEDMSLGQFLARPVRVRTMVWNGVTAYQTFDLLSDWLSSPTVANKVANYYKIKGVLKVRLVVNGNPYNYGAMIASLRAVPSEDATSFRYIRKTAVNNQKPTQFMQMPHVILDPSALGSYELERSLMSPFGGWVDIITRAGASVDIHMNPLVVLRTTQGTVTPLTINMYCWMENVELAVIGAQSGIAERTAKGPISTLGTVVSNVGSAIRPLSGRLATTLEFIGSTTAAIANHFGFSKQIALDQMAVTLLRRNTDFGAAMAARFFGYKTSGDPNAGVAITPDAVGFGGVEDTSIMMMAQKFDYVSQIVWADTATALSSLEEYQISPTCCAMVGQSAFPTRLAYMSAPFSFWGGGLKFRITVYASPFHRGTLRLIHMPYGLGGLTPAQAAAKATNTYPSKIVDINGKTEVEFCCDWTRPSNFIAVSEANNDTLTGSANVSFHQSDSSAVGQRVANGLMLIIVETPLTCSTTPVPPVDIVLEMAACEDFRLAKPSINNVLGYFPLTVSSVVPFNPLVDVDEEEDVVAQSGPYKLSFGEVFTDVKQLTKIATPFLNMFNGFPVTAVTRATLVGEQVIPAYPPIPSPSSFVYTTVGSAPLGFTFSSYFEAIYYAQRGGYRYSFQNTIPTGSTPALYNAIWLSVGHLWNKLGIGKNATDTYAVGGNASGLYSVYEGSPGGLATPVLLNNGAAIEIELPSMDPGDYRVANNGGWWLPDQTTSTNRGPTCVYRRSVACSNPSTDLATGGHFTTLVYSATADDYSLYGFDFCPRMDRYTGIT